MSEKIISNLNSPDFRNSYYEKYKTKTAPFWNRINVQGQNAQGYKKFDSIKILNADQKGISITKSDTPIDKFGHIDFEENKFAIDRFYQEEVYALHNEIIYIKIADDVKIKEPVYIEYELSEQNPQLLDFAIIEMGTGSQASIVVNYKSADNFSSYKNSVLKVFASEYSNLKLSRVQNLNLESYSYDFSDFNVSDNANVDYYTVEFGAKNVISSSTAYLNGHRASMSTSLAYLADLDRKVDLAYSVIFRGKNTDGKINGCGAVMHDAIKVFRGNIYFEKGSKGSNGREGSFDILLDKTVQSHSIPTLFCDEDDVIGEHYASIGKIDDVQLLYLMSRGISEQLARKVIVESSFRPTIDNIEHEETKNILLDELNRRI